MSRKEGEAGEYVAAAIGFPAPESRAVEHAPGGQAVDLKQEAMNMLELAGSHCGPPALLTNSSRVVQAILKQF